jgi:hypothetical protein
MVQFSQYLYEETSFFSFALVTLLMGGAAAWMTGRACAVTWRPVYTLAFYLLILGLGVRFIHFSVFHGTLLSPYYYMIDTIILLLIGFAGYRYTRANQMVRQYYWIYEKVGIAGYRPKH